MKCLSVKSEYTSMIAGGEKAEEYRSWKTNYRGPILIAVTIAKRRLRMETG